MSQLFAVNRIIKTVLAVGGVLALLLVLWLTVGVGATVRDAAATGDVDRLRRALASGTGRAAVNGTDRYGYGPCNWRPRAAIARPWSSFSIAAAMSTCAKVPPATPP